MYYSSFVILAIIHHFIINYDVLKKAKSESRSGPGYRYRQYLSALLLFYITDSLWGFLMDLGIRSLVYADTMLFFATMAMSVLLWTRYVAAFINKKRLRATSFMAAGWGIFGFVILSLLFNFFYPVIFSFSEDAQYTPCPGRHVLMGLQLLLYMIISIYSLIISRRSEGRDKVHYMAVFASGSSMVVFILLQAFNPFAPFYTVGCMITNCLFHVFVEEDEKEEQGKIAAVNMMEIERYSQIAFSLAKEYEAIYYIDVETGRYMEISASEEYRKLGIQQSGEDFYADTRANALKYAHPDDRLFAESMYFRQVMEKNLQGRNSYSYRYRIMVGDEARYYRFDVMMSEDGKHFIVCDKDIQDTITAETARLEEKKKNITFSRIAESLASNYDVIYYIDLETDQYVGYTSHNIYGELKVDDTGDDFFETARKNATVVIHPQDRERMLTVMEKDNILSALEERKQFEYQYRLIINDRSQHTRLFARKSSDGRHLIIGVENIENEVEREKKHMLALKTEKELARRDELTGIRNRTAYNELAKSVQDNLDKGIDYLPFALAVCDLNDLKKINDTRGHKVGDEYIRSAAELLCRIFDHSPVFRIGGDEFAVFLRGDDYTNREKLMRSLRRASEINRDSRKGPVIAAGMAEYDSEEDRAVSDTFSRADRRMYEHKRELKSLRSINESSP